MQFGRVSIEELEDVDFTLTEDHRDNSKILGGLKAVPNIYVGCAKWGRKDWVGKIYPKGTIEKDFLSHYVNHFGCIEMNATHYRVFDQKTIERWKSVANSDFRFCPKFTQTISHYKKLTNATEDTIRFYEQIKHFEGLLGPCFLQLHHSYAPDRVETIEKYLRSLPVEIPVFLELRHPDWFLPNNPAMDHLAELCSEMNFGLVITDTAGRRDVLHNRLTSKTAFIRFVGNSLHRTDYKRIDSWVDRLVHWVENGLQELYFFMHMHDEVDSPELTDYLIKKLNKRLNLEIRAPKLIEQTGSLF